jgi:hypothetical protein
MAKKQTRRSISVKGTTYRKLSDFCLGRNISRSGFVELMLADNLGSDAPVRLRLRQEIDELKRRVQASARRESELSKEVEHQKILRRREREMLVGWIDNRIKQQKGALKPYVSERTREIVEVEIGLLKRYREDLVAAKHRSGAEDPLIPQYA